MEVDDDELGNSGQQMSTHCEEDEDMESNVDEEAEHSEDEDVTDASKRCEQCQKKGRATNVYDGRSTRCCKSCAKTHDHEWYAAYVAATRCEKCKEQKRAENVYNGRSTRCCVSCAKTHDHEWYKAWSVSQLCKHHAVSGCGMFGKSTNKGYCIRCLTFLFPEDKRARFYRSKELAVGHFIRDCFPDVDWSFDKRIEGGCSRRRPDIFLHLGSHALTIEIDEFEHQAESYSCVCERRKMMEHFEDAGNVPHVFIRFNPDSYMDHVGTKHPGCWGKTPTTGEPRVAPRQVKQWEARLEKLQDIVAHWIAHVPDKEIEAMELFYSSNS